MGRLRIIRADLHIRTDADWPIALRLRPALPTSESSTHSLITVRRHLAILLNLEVDIDLER